MEYNIHEVARITGADLSTNDDYSVSRLLTDSRSLLDAEGTLFFALRTSSGDGHRYISDLYERGVRAFVVEAIPDCALDMPGAIFLKVHSPLEALQALARHHRMTCSGAKVIAITGSRGKTTVKEWLYRLLSPDFKVARSPRSYNSQTGVPLSLWGMDKDTGIALVEAGISQPGEMERLEEMISPEIGVFTNIGAAHSHGFTSTEEKCREKASLMKGCRKVVYCADNGLIASCLPDGPERVGWTRHDAPDARIVVSDVVKSDGHTLVSYSCKGDGGCEGRFTIPFTSERDIENALHSLTVMLLMGVAPTEIESRMETDRKSVV